MGENEKAPLLKPEDRVIETDKDLTTDSKRPVATDLEHGDAIKLQHVGFGRIMRLARPEAHMLVLATIALFVSSFSNVLLPTFAGKVIDIVTSHPDTEEGREAALKAVNHTILLIVAVILTGSVATMIRAYLFSAASERVVARPKKDLFSHLIDHEAGQVLVTVGTTLFDALVKETSSQPCLQALADLGYSSLLIQRGKGTFTPRESDGKDGGLKVSYFDFTSNLKDLIGSSALVISHAGSGSIFETLLAEKPLVVVVNDLLMDNHQCELAEELAGRKHLVYATSPATLVRTLRGMDLASLVPYAPGNPLDVMNAVDEYLGIFHR